MLSVIHQPQEGTPFYFEASKASELIETEGKGGCYGLQENKGNVGVSVQWIWVGKF